MRDVLDAAAVRQWGRLAADALGRTRGEIDALNVFPVPDGDTGTNLHLTVLAAAEAVEALPAGADLAAAWAALAKGALFGARGNSGIIVSQLFRAFADVLGEAGTPDTDSPGEAPGALALAKALERAAALARSAVAHPVEGTILSVLDAAADGIGTDRTLATAARSAAVRARAALERTTEQLAVLADNGVVDAGGAGLCVVLDALAAALGEEFPDQYVVPARSRADVVVTPVSGSYEVMYLLDAADEAVPALRDALDGLGDSVVVVGGDGLWNVHAHVDDAGAAIEAGLAAGRPYQISVTYLQATPDA